MQKMAIFVEGQTEQLFAEQLVYEVAGRHRVHIDTVRAHGGRVSPRVFLEVTATSRPSPDKQYYVVIYDSSSDGRVLSDIRERYENLTAQGFREVVGIRDVFPQTPADIPAIRANFSALAPSTPVPTTLVLSVMEVEAWFLAEHTHYPKIHPALTLPAVAAALGYDPATADIQRVTQPSGDLRRAYLIAGVGYGKNARHVQRTASALDYAEVYLQLPDRFPDLKVLADSLDRFLSR